MVARILGKLLHMVGILPTDKVTEVQRTDLVGEFVGHTGPKTRRKVFYSLFFCQKGFVSCTIFNFREFVKQILNLFLLHVLPYIIHCYHDHGSTDTRRRGRYSLRG
jgi:hypothetical protein